MDYPVTTPALRRHCLDAGGAIDGDGVCRGAVGSRPSAGSRGHWSWASSPLPGWYHFLGYVGAAAGTYHGYKRHRGSIGWAIGWGLLGGILPVITLPLSAAQGFGKPKGR
jgi:hypothetical protein